ncbi:transcription factor [Ganoderma sinense ZZ0214-1]|uniref:Transcription factor n=1 Tax=Ganoderma sinense ZZ0214-1 TaxID=1077348 RepID=A0A2G8SPT6_9APHY|nr:transcription factor [Ganoderma sinense ZZ0214-1]
MVGLPFPNSGANNREQSWDNGTPFSSSGDIPIDPALSETPVDPALLAEEGVSRSIETPHPHPLYPPYQSSRVDSYPQGPQGDPFAQPPPVYIPVEEPVPLPAKPVKKRKRPVAREEECGFCSGNDSENRHGQPELMVSCVDCGRSGHPSCMDLDNMGDAMRSYEWQCATCKSCNVCRRKGNEASMLICDFCDRGPDDLMVEGLEHEQSPEIQEISPSFPPEREISVASSSHHLPPSSDTQHVPDHVVTTDASEVEADTVGRTPRKRTKGRKSRKGKEVARDEEDEHDPPSITPLPTIRKLRIRINSPPPPVVENETPTIRLRVPARGKGKAREDAAEEPFERGLFDDILSVDDRDIRETTIKDGDILRFDRSRATAEVCSLFCTHAFAF